MDISDCLMVQIFQAVQGSVFVDDLLPRALAMLFGLRDLIKLFYTV